MKRINITLFEGDNGVFSSAAGLTPDEAVRHVLDLANEDLEDLQEDARLAVAFVRPLKMRSRPPAPFMPRIDGRRTARNH